jgi:hypothetical protein
MSNFDDKLEIIRNLSQDLVPYNFPMAPVDLEYYIAPLKKTEVEVDGYTIVFHLNRALYNDNYYLETFQVFNKYAPFLPFHLVTKLAKKALGGHFLSLVEFYQEDKKIYCWSVCLDKRGRPFAPPNKQKSNSRVFEGFEYMYVTPEQLNLY